ncbi:MAG: DNA repair protein RadC [Lentisphaeria bacterium]|nr:DNA repair protein RadC [Lentisphaeria bacterium]
MNSMEEFEMNENKKAEKHVSPEKNCSGDLQHKNLVSESAAVEKQYCRNDVPFVPCGKNSRKTKVSPNLLFKNSSERKYTGADPAFGKQTAERFAAGKLICGEEKKENKSEKKPLHAGHRQRLRERYLQAGSDGMADYDVLELLLTYCIPQRDVKPPARALLEKFRTLGGVFDADMEEVCTVSGISENSALLFRVLRDLSTRYLKEKMLETDVMDSPHAVQNYARMKLGGYREEVMMIIYLNTRNHVIDSRIVSRGTVNSAVVYPRNIAEEALLRKAAGVILVHNHPSGYVQPSEEDREFTMSVKRSLALLDIHLLDHLIISRNASYSFLQNEEIL